MRKHQALLAGLVRVAWTALFAAALAGLAGVGTAADQKLAPCEYDGVERIVAVGDIHGAYDRFIEILKTAGVVDDRQRWAAGRTHLVQIGDMLDRGPDSRKVIDFLQGLIEPARRAGGAVHLLLGNHEVMRMLGDLRYVSPGEYAAFVTTDSATMQHRYVESVKGGDRNKLLAETPLGFVEMRMAFGRNGEYGKWLRTLDTVIRVNDIVFVHGGLSPEVASKPCNIINETVRRELTTDLDKTRANPLRSLVASADGPLWYRGLAQEPETFEPKVDEILSKQGARAIVVGHTVQREGRIQVRFGGKVFELDTGMQPAYVPNGRASALEIQQGVFTAIYLDRRDVLAGKPDGVPK